MQRRNSPRTRLAAAAAVFAIVLAACGDDSPEPAADQPGDTLPTPETTVPTSDIEPPGADAIEHPTGTVDVIVEVAFEGGFLPPEGVFTQLPLLLVAGDGRKFVQGPQVEIYPGPLLPNVQVSDLGEDDIQAVLDLAAEHGLLTERNYESPTNVADAPDTVVTIRANGETYVHRAYALGLGGGLDGSDGETGDRAELQAFVEAATAGVVADDRSFEPENYLVRATPVEDLSVYDVEPTVIEWPAGVSLDLAGASECSMVPASEVAELFADTNQLTFFVDAGVTYQVSVKPQLPGTEC